MALASFVVVLISLPLLVPRSVKVRPVVVNIVMKSFKLLILSICKC